MEKDSRYYVPICETEFSRLWDPLSNNPPLPESVTKYNKIQNTTKFNKIQNTNKI